MTLNDREPEKMEIGDFFTFNTNISTRGHPYKLYVHHNRLDDRKQFFACRVVNIWNSLSAECTNYSCLLYTSDAADE